MKEIEMQRGGGGECWDVLIANQWSLIYQPHGYIQKVSACVKFWRCWNSPTIFWSHWNAKACRYRFVLMGANTRGDTPVVSLIAFNDSIRVLSPLCHLVSVQIWNHNPHRNIDCRHPSIVDYKLPVLQLTLAQYLFEVSLCKSKDIVLFRLKAIVWKTAGPDGCLPFCVDALFSPCHLLYRDPSGDIHSSFVFPRGDSLIYCMRGVAFLEGGISGIWKILRQWRSFCLFFVVLSDVLLRDQPYLDRWGGFFLFFFVFLGIPVTVIIFGSKWCMFS